MIYMIAAISKNNQIGLNRQMPWHLPEDLQYFKEITNGHTVVMGSSSDPLTPVTIMHSLDSVLNFLSKEQVNFIIGGGEIYKAFLPYADRLYLTLIDQEVEGDTSFPSYKHAFKCIKQMPGFTTTEDGSPISFTIWERCS